MTSNGLPHDQLFKVLRLAATLPQIREDVIDNHDDNRWWPLAVTDWRLRLIVAGWSTRVSYNMISTYRRVVARANDLGYEGLYVAPYDELKALVAPLGLASERIRYMQSTVEFIERSRLDYSGLAHSHNDVLIELFASTVHGAGYKVAQCAILYAKGYHCGIFPVDSGMKDMLGPCLGLSLPAGPKAHEVMRKHVETLLKATPSSYYDLAMELGYGGLKIPVEQAPIWWAHLVLVYFKRRFCNRHEPRSCPLRNNIIVGDGLRRMCERQHRVAYK